ncbi:MAG: hypothetical protein GY797_32095 [Deltaproteobacteria bacterium]|nr:hypothetical protein [Deltaproteobacteria bacterium]
MKLSKNITDKECSYSDRNFLFELGIKEDLKLCVLAESIQICSRAGYQTATILRQSTTWIQIPDTDLIVKKAFFSDPAKMLEFWAQEAYMFQ